MFNRKAPHKEDGMDLLIRALGSNSSGDAIMGQEADGQRSFVNSDTLPKEMSCEDRATLEAAGVVFGDVVQGDDLFQYVQFPQGWHLESTSHSMHNNLLDDKGRKRAGIFYKAAFYDRRADLLCVRRFNMSLDYDQLDKGIAQVSVMDGDNVAFTTEPVGFEEDKARYDAQDKARALAVAWINKHYPNWEDASAYWD